MADIIAIDGPASVGKSSLAKKIAVSLDASVLHSGKLYRAVALEMIKKEIKISNKKEIIKCIKSISEEDLKSSDLFSSEIDTLSSMISSKKYVRAELKNYQRNFPKLAPTDKKFIVIEGRDIGTVVFPNTKYKIFMWADAKVRAKRRYEQLSKKGEKVRLNRIYREILARDAKDINRKVAPLKPAINSVLLDTTYLDIEQAFNAIKSILK